MKFAFKTKRSAGIRVTRAVHRLISDGNKARDAGDWSAAAQSYRKALASARDLPHIQIQLGHMLKQAGRLEEADQAYADAARLRPEDIDLIRFRANLAKDSGRLGDAVGLFEAALQSVHRDEAAAEINRIIETATPFSAAELTDLLQPFGMMRRRPSAAIPHDEAGRDGAVRPLVIDITDLVGHFAHQRLPNGIERVQMELLRAALNARADRVHICCFESRRESWVGIEPELFLNVAKLAASGTDVMARDWQAARAQLMLNLMIAPVFAMPMRAILINAGTSWRVHDYFRFVRNAREGQDIRYVPFIHDLIPIVASEHCVAGVTEDFISWLIGAIRHADGFLANSQATRADLLRVAKALGHPLPPDRVAVIPLDADFRRASDPLPPSALDAWRLTDVPFALIVSTIESRKNHILAFEAWAALIRRHGGGIPRLVCVGQDGWLNAHIFARLDEDPVLRAHVTIIHRVSDAELALLYRSCRFTLYPSLYEGWGLPVTESLSYGRIPIVADNSSLLEAGGPFALFFTSGSVSSLVDAVERLLFDDDWRVAREAKIAAEFAPRSWAQLEAQIEDVATAFAADDRPDDRPVSPNLYYPVSLRKQRHVWNGLASGEIFRHGDGWLWPETDGCRIAPEGGELRVRLAGEGAGPLRLCLRLRGLSLLDCPVTITIDGREAGRAVVPRGTCRWLICELPSGEGGNLAILIRGEASESVTLSIAGIDRSRPATVALMGFLLDDGRDQRVLAALRDDVGASHLDALDAYRDAPPQQKA